MVTLDARIERCLPTKDLFIKWIRSWYLHLWEYYTDIYQDAVVRVLSIRPQLERVADEKEDETERNRVFYAYIRKVMEREAGDRAVFYSSIYSIPAHHGYKKITPAFVPNDAPAIGTSLDDDRVTPIANTPTEEDLLFQIELERVEARLSTDAKTLLYLLIDKFHRREILEIMDITLWRYRTLMEELRRELKLIIT